MNKKDLQKILLISVINYMIVFGVSFLISSFFSFDVVWLLMITLSIFLLVYYWYFSAKPKSPIKEGIIIGLLLALFTFVIEFLLWFSIFGWFYFWNFSILLQYVLIIIVPIFAALLKKEKEITAKKKESNWKDRLSN